MDSNNTMFTESNFASCKEHTILSKLWEFIFAILFLYVFFAQNVFSSVSGMIIVFCGLSAIFWIANVLFINNGSIRINYMFGIACFVIVSLIASFVCSNSLQDSLDVGFRMIEYLIIGCSLYAFITSYPQRFISIIRYMWLSITLLCIFVLFDGTEVTGAGAIGIKTLNVNLLSSYIMIHLLCGFILIGNTSRKIETIIYSSSIGITLFVQILSASRRGFIVACAFLLLAVVFGIIPRYAKKRIILKNFIIICLLIALVFISDYVMNKTLLGQRFLGNFNTGDALRKVYHDIALREFLHNPIFGIGLNGLKSVMGVYSHSLYYETLSCTGLIGTAILVVSVFSLGLSLYKYSKRSTSNNVKDVYITKICFLFLGALLVAGIAVTTIYDFYFYICLAVMSSVVSINKRSK